MPLLPASLVSTLLPLLKPSSNVDTLTAPSSSSSSSSPSPSHGHGNNTMTNGTHIPDISKLTPDDLNRLRSHLMVFPNRLAIESLFRFLYKISQYSDYSSMTVSNLAIVWSPTICREQSSPSMASMVTMSPKVKNKGSKSDHSMAASFENQRIKSPAMNKSKMTPSQSVSSNNLLLESVSNFMKDSRILVEFLITNIDTIFCISRSDLVLPSPPVSVVMAPPSGYNSNIGRNSSIGRSSNGHNSAIGYTGLNSSRPTSKTSTIDSRNESPFRSSLFTGKESSDVLSVPRGIRPPSIGCQRVKVIPNASPYDIFLRIILERRTWDPLVTEIIDEGSGVQKIRQSFSSFLRPSTSSSNGGSLRINGTNRYTRCKSLTRSVNSPCHRRSVSTSSSDSRRRTSSRGSSLTGGHGNHGDCDPDECSDHNARYLTIKRKWPDKLDPSVQVIQIHEESLDDPSSRTKTSTGMPTYICDWFIKSSAPSSSSSPSKNGSSGNQPSSEISVAIYHDLKGRPFCWYKKSFPRLVDCYLNRISSFFNESTSNPDGLVDVVDTNMATAGHWQSRGAEGNNGQRRVPTFDPFCCISMKHVVQA